MAKNRQTALAGWLEKAREFLEGFPVESMSARPVVQKLRTAAQFVYLVVQGFVRNRCPLRAAALCYTTLLALVPLLAVVFSISKSFLRDKSANGVPVILDGFVKNVAPQLDLQDQAKQQVIEYIQSFIGNIDAGKLGTLGTVLLALVAVRLLMTIEQTFNDIWGVQQGRSVWRKVVYYWTSITLGPLVLLTALAVTGTAEFADALAVVPFQRVLLQLTPYAILWVGFAFMYGLMPNTRVSLHAALIGGIVAGTLWQLNSQLSAMYLSRVVAYSRIYGSLGIVPVFLVGLYFSWVIILLGAQVSFAAQNVRTYLQQRASERIDQAGRELLACRVVLHAAHSFLHGSKPPNAAELAEQLRAPLQALNQLVYRLVAGGVLVEVADGEGGLQPGRPPESLTVTDVLQVMRRNAGSLAEDERRPAREMVEQLLHDLDGAARKAPANENFRDLAKRLDSSDA